MRAMPVSKDREQLSEAIWNHLTLANQSRRARPAVMSYAIELWMAHLVLLEQVLSVAKIPWEKLRAEELDGLLLLREARERFQREYRACGECGAAVKGKICPRCGAVS